MTPILLWAQALDNTSPDHIEYMGQDLSAEDIAQRAKAAATLSEVSMNARFQQVERVKVGLASERVLLEVPAEEADAIGRVAPLLVCAEFSIGTRSQDITQMVAQLEGFAHKIGRTISPEHKNIAMRLLERRLLRRGCLSQLWPFVVVVVVASLAVAINSRWDDRAATDGLAEPPVTISQAPERVNGGN